VAEPACRSKPHTRISAHVTASLLVFKSMQLQRTPERGPSTPPSLCGGPSTRPPSTAPLAQANAS
jgi:hypothetical protein